MSENDPQGSGGPCDAKKVIPATPILERYQALKKMPQKQRLAEVRRLIDDPQELAHDFAKSVADFAGYENCEEGFYPDRVIHKFGSGIQRTIDVALRLDEQKRLVPKDASHRVTTHVPGPSVSAVPASSLVCDYVDREILVHRTTGPRKWSDEEFKGSGMRLDLLLADAEDRTPIIAELKLEGDKGPFFALVQALACAAHIATTSQYRRMQRHLNRGAFPALSSDPRVDVWLLFVDAERGQARKGLYMPYLLEATDVLAPLLLAEDGIRASVRRIACLYLSLDSRDRVEAEVRWAWGQSEV